MADALNKQRTFLTWEESAAALQTDARQGMARAQRLLSTRNLRELYENGSGITLDTTIASHWYGLAALQGDSIAKKHLKRLAQPNTLFEKSVNPCKEAP